jgi:hypothetical protein
VSTTPYVLGAIALAAGVRTLFWPHRAVVREGGVAACPGKNAYNVCDPTLPIDTPDGAAVYSVVTGRVVAVGPGFVHLASRHEPVVVYYDDVLVDVGEGQYVGRGQRIGTSRGRLYFGVQQWIPGGELVNVEPASWLAARGNRIAARYTGGGSDWCEQRRHISVPRSAGAPCQFHEPDSSAFALLPVTVEVER